MKYCNCGCGRVVKPGNRFVHGHNPTKGTLGKKRSKDSIEKGLQTKIKNGTNKHSQKTIEKMSQTKMISRATKICACGCGRTFECKTKGIGSKQKFINGHNSRGKANCRKGKIITPRITRICKCGCGETFICKKISHKRFIAGHHLKDKTYEEIYGIEGTKILKKKISHNKESHWNWKGGISFEKYPQEFNKELKEFIRKRDNYTCQECNYTQKQLGYKLDVHHIDYNKKNNDPLNLISLCRSCNVKTNFNRNDWENYYKIKLKERVGT